MSIWVKKYAPQTSGEVQGQNQAVQRLKEYLQNYKKGQKPLFLHGPQGVGKTSSVHALAKELNFEIIEVNASDIRNADSINEVLGSAIQQRSLFFNNKVILIDEVDGLAGNKDRGGVQAITKLVSDSVFPIVITANDAYKKSIKSLQKKCELLEYNNLAYTSIVAYLRNIVEKENIETDEETLSGLARSCGGDLRAAINDLQSFSGDGKLTKEDLEMAYSRDHTEKILNALVRVFKTTNAEVALSAFDDVQDDLDTIFLWVDENLPKEYTKPEDLANGFANLALADVFRGRIRKWQYYRFYVYCFNLLSAGIALSKDEKYAGFTSYKQSSRLLSIWMANQKNAKKKAIASKIAKVTHTSEKRAYSDIMPFLKAICEEKIDFANLLAQEADLEKEELDWLTTKK